MFHYFETRRAEQGNMVFIKVHGEAVCCQTTEEGGAHATEGYVGVSSEWLSFFLLLYAFFPCTQTYDPYQLFDGERSWCPLQAEIGKHSLWSINDIIPHSFHVVLTSGCQSGVFFHSDLSVCLSFLHANTHPLSLTFLLVKSHIFLTIASQFRVAYPPPPPSFHSPSYLCPFNTNKIQYFNLH